MTSSLKELKSNIAKCATEDRPIILKAMVFQFSECFRRFCVKNEGIEAWDTFIGTLSCIDQADESRKVASCQISKLVEKYEDALHDSDVPAMDTLSLLEAALNPSEESFFEALETYFHVIGFFNLRLSEGTETQNLDWVDLSVPATTQVRELVNPYVEYCDTPQDSTSLLHKVMLRSAIDTFDIVAKIPLTP